MKLLNQLRAYLKERELIRARNLQRTYDKKCDTYSTNI